MSTPASPVDELESTYKHLRPTYEIFKTVAGHQAFVGTCVLSDGTCARLLYPGADTKKHAKSALALLLLTELVQRRPAELCRAKITSVGTHGVKAKVTDGSGVITFSGMLSERVACVGTELIIMHAPAAQTTP